MTASAQPQRNAVLRVVTAYPDFTCRVRYNVGPGQDRAAVACPGGGYVIVGPDGTIIADSRTTHPEERE